ncbi:MAG TPA: flagellar filament capping protein FliD [Bryobacteraceae bacterium]|jgi:flagellar hook-associated protein 2|nr:flagellar filament capping protein FliD [Bryobacteraceae bacterium]
MASSSTAATTSTASTSSAPVFSGTSTYASQFNSAITRAVAIFSLPITQLQSDQTTLTSQASALGSIDADFTALQTAVQAIDTAVSGSSFNTTISNTDALTASTSDGATEGNYSVQIDSIGAFATSLTSSTWNAASGPAQTYTLTVGSSSFNIKPSDNSAASVVAAINAQQGSLVQATVVNVGSNSSPDYRISLQNQSLGDSPVNLQLNGTDLQTAQTQGALATYEVNGSGVQVTSTSRTANIAPGLSVQLQQQTTSPVNVTVTRSSSALATALSNFADSYNTCVSAVDEQRGQNGGALQGQQISFDLSNALASMGTYAGGSLGGLSGVGLTLNADGTFTFNQSTLLSQDFTSSSAVNSFLGSISNQNGFLGSINNILNGLEDSTTGAIKTTEAAYVAQSTRMTNEIANEQQQAALLQTNLINQMTQADSLIATMQSQYSYLTAVFNAEQVQAQQNASV